MKLMVSLFRGVALLLLALAGAGCPQEGQNPFSDEEREPHFIEGGRHVREMDYQAAIESFEKALSVNRGSAAAHWELAVLFESKVPDAAAAIYHYERFLKLRPNSDKAESARQQILACKQDLARTVSLGPVTEKVQRELEKLIEENRRLNDDNRRLNQELREVLVGHPFPATNPAVRPVAPAAAKIGSGTPSLRTGVVAPLTGSAGPVARPPGTVEVLTPASTPMDPRRALPAAAPRVHVIQAHETLGSIARQYGFKLDLLYAANPGLNPRRLQPGQKLNLPP